MRSRPRRRGGRDGCVRFERWGNGRMASLLFGNRLPDGLRGARLCSFRPTDKGSDCQGCHQHAAAHQNGQRGSLSEPAPHGRFERCRFCGAQRRTHAVVGQAGEDGKRPRRGRRFGQVGQDQLGLPCRGRSDGFCVDRSARDSHGFVVGFKKGDTDSSDSMHTGHLRRSARGLPAFLRKPSRLPAVATRRSKTPSYRGTGVDREFASVNERFCMRPFFATSPIFAG